MEQCSSAPFYACFLGDFSLYYGGAQIWGKRSYQKKYVQILMALLKGGKRGVSRQELLAIVWNKEEESRRGRNNLNQHLYYLRKFLSALNLPRGKYVVRERYKYYFTLDYQIQSDTEHLDQVLEKLRNASDSSKACLLREFCRSYTGDFLPELRQEVWAEESRAYYHRQYFSCLRRLCRILEEQKEYDELLKLCTSAARIYPYDQWQLVQLRCLMAMKRYEEAFTLYERTISCFERNFGIHVEEKAAADCWSNLKLTSNGAGALIRIQDELREKTREEGAYFCSVLSFGDLYRIVTRMKERRKIEPFLLVCTLGGNETQEAEEEWIEKLRCFLQENLRRGDVYARYSKRQFLVLLVEAKEAPEIEKRLLDKWQAVNSAGTMKYVLTVRRLEEKNARKP